MNDKSGIPCGSLWGLLLAFLYIQAFIWFGMYHVWTAEMPHTFTGWLSLIGTSLSYLIAAIIGFIPLLMISLYLIIRDRNIVDSFRNHWPIFAALLYIFIPNVPGPIDDAMVSGIASCLEVYFIYRRRQLSRTAEEYNEIIEIKRTPRLVEKK